MTIWDLSLSGKFEDLKEKPQEELLCQDDYGQTLLHYTAARGSEALSILEWLIGSLHDAISGDKEESVGILNTADNQGFTALHVAAANGHVDIISLLLKLGASISSKDFTKATALHHASMNGHSGAVELLLSAGVPVDAQEEKGATALHLAAARGHVAVAKLLIEKGKANVDAKDWRETRPVHYAASHGHLEMFQLLKQSGSSLELRDRDSRALLHFVCHSGSADLLACVLSAQSSNNDTNHVRNHPIAISPIFSPIFPPYFSSIFCFCFFWHSLILIAGVM